MHPRITLEQMKSELLQKYLFGEDSLKQGKKDLPLK